MTKNSKAYLALYIIGTCAVGLGIGWAVYHAPSAFAEILHLHAKPEASVQKTLAAAAILSQTPAETPAAAPEEDNAQAVLAASTSDFIRPFNDARQKLLASGVPFMEVNLPENVVKKYDASGADTTAPIVSATDPQGWGGVPAGLYSILDKSAVDFSADSQVDMPDALHLYGKYFIHGTPYYPDKGPSVPATSGGAIQLGNSDIENIYASTAVGTPTLVVDKDYDSFVYPAGKSVPLPDVTAQSYLIADLDSGQVLAQKNSDVVHPIASITKLMNAVVVTENTDLRKSTTVTSKDLGVFGTTPGLVLGNKYRLVDLMYPLLIESSNQAAETLTGFLGRSQTIALMNAKAKDLFMNSTTYVDPSGLSAGDKSTAHDLYLLGRYILNNRTPMLDITRGETVPTFGQISFNLTAMDNKNEFASDPDFLGGKTGFIEESKNTGLFMFTDTIGGTPRRIAIVVLDSDGLKKDSDALKDWITQKYQ